jgi:hypothetical protein
LGAIRSPLPDGPSRIGHELGIDSGIVQLVFANGVLVAA